MHEETKLWRRNSLGIGTWRVYLVTKTSTIGTIAVSHSIVEGGAEISHMDRIVTNGSGRSLDEQITLEMNSRIRRQLDKGYKTDRETAVSLGSTNQLNLKNPMLAQPLGKVRLKGSDFEDAWVQPKFDGHRCLITKQNGDMIAYTRKGKIVETIPHILEDCERWMQDGDTLDGELYKHGVMLQDIGSAVKRGQALSSELDYMWYDMVLDHPFSTRWKTMTDLHANVENSHIVLTPTYRVHSMTAVYDVFKQHRAVGMEGSMLRLSVRGYDDGKRSDQLIKVKEREDGEVHVLDCRPSRDGWAILRVRFHAPINDGPSVMSEPRYVEFDISAPGSVAQRTEVLENFEKYRGKQLTIEYAMLTNDGIPFHAVATRWRDDV